MRRLELASAGSAKFREGTQEGATAAAAPPDEDTMVVPVSWRRVIQPRRGGAPGPAVKLQPGTWEQEGATFVHGNARIAVSRTDIPGSAGQYSGSAPRDAAKLALRAMSRYDDKLWVFVDTWVAERGVAFAAAATAILNHDGSNGGTQARHEAFLRMRRILAAANDADYAEAVQALAGLRGSHIERVLVSYLVPTEPAWADEVCAAYRQGRHPHLDFERRLVVCILSTREQLARVGSADLLVSYYTGLAEIGTLVDGIGVAALPAIAEVAENKTGYVSTDARRAAFAALAQLPSDEAFEMLAGRLDEKYVSSAVLEAMARFPVRALRVLAKTANGGGKSAPPARMLLTSHVRTHAHLLDGVLPTLPEKDAELITALAHETEGRPEAPTDALPPLLVAPPWTRRRAKRTAPTVLAGLEPPRMSRVEWAPGEREAWAATDRRPDGDTDWDVVAKRYTVSGFDAFWGSRDFFTRAPEHLARPLLPRWIPDCAYWNLVEALGAVVARFEHDALAPVLATARNASPVNSGQILQAFVDPSVARLMADWFTRLKSGRAAAASWLTRHAQPAALLLIPDAVGEPGAGRVAAENALRFLAPLTDVRAAAEHYGPEAVAAVEAILAFDPLELHPQRMPAIPAWVEGAQLPQILLRGREQALPADAARHVLSMLAISKPGEPYAGLAVVRESADPRSLAEFAWAVFAAWQAMDMPSKDGWALTALGWFGDDDTVRRLAGLIRAWPGEGGHQRAVAGLEVLAELGTDVALMQLHQISQRVRFKALKARAQEKIADIARGLELTADQLSDRLVPDFGLDAEGGMWLDYGPRRFRVGFDEQLKPFVADEAGGRRKDLPPPNAKDDPELAPAARKQFSALKKDVRTIAAEVIRRLETAMVTGRDWSAEEFRDLLLGHPLVWHITRRLVWLCGADSSADGAATAFRIAEDRTLATVDDEEFTLPEDARVRLAHPLHLADDLAAWAELFADYEILQPFEQLGRPVYALTEQERAERRLTRFEGVKVPVGKVLGLVSRGWQRGTPMDAGVENNISRKVDENLHLIVDLEPGIAVGYINELGDQTLREVYLGAGQDDYWRWGNGDTGAPLGTLDPITASELLRDLTRLTN